MVVVVCMMGFLVGLGFCVVATRVLSQHTEPCLQFVVFDISTEGRSQKAAIIFNKQKPGHLGMGG